MIEVDTEVLLYSLVWISWIWNYVLFQLALASK